MSEQEIVEIEMDIATQKELLANRNKLRRLEANQDFTDLFITEYIHNRSKELVWSLSDPAQRDEKHQQLLIQEMKAIGSFREYCQMVHQFGNTAEHLIAQGEQALEELSQESSN